MKRDEQFYLNIINNLYDGLYFVNNDRQIIFWSSGAERISGYTSNEVVGYRCYDDILKHIDYQGNNLCQTSCPLSATLSDGQSREVNAYLHHKDGNRVPVIVNVTPFYGKNKKIIGAIEIFRDSSKETDYIETLERLKKEVFTDQLTQIPNRKFAVMQLNSSIFNLQYSSVSFGVILFDIDHFKRFNDTYGHKAGDLVLKMITKTVYDIMRDNDYICRWGGEEFIAVINGCNREGLHGIAERVRRFIADTWLKLDNENLQVTVSLGYTLAQKNDTLESVIDRADMLMYRSKKDGRNRLTGDPESF